MQKFWWLLWLQAKRTLEAPSQVHRRLLQRSADGPHGGWGGRRQDRHFVYSRFRSAPPHRMPNCGSFPPSLRGHSLSSDETLVCSSHSLESCCAVASEHMLLIMQCTGDIVLTVGFRHRHIRSVRDEESAVYRSCTFLGNFAALALGTHSGEVRIHDTLSGDLIDTLDAHDTPAYQLRVSVSPPPSVPPLGHMTQKTRVLCVVPAEMRRDLRRDCAADPLLIRCALQPVPAHPVVCKVSDKPCHLLLHQLKQASCLLSCSACVSGVWSGVLCGLPAALCLQLVVNSVHRWILAYLNHVCSVRQAYEGRGRSLLLSSSRMDARLWDIGACSDRAGASWTPAEYVTDPLHTLEGMRNAVFRPDGRMVREPRLCCPHPCFPHCCKRTVSASCWGPSSSPCR